MSNDHNAYIFANVDKSKDLVEIAASTLDGTQPVKLEDVEEGLAAYSLIEWRLNLLAGRILTQCDATFNDPVQRKAFKDEIRSKFADEFGFFSEHMLRGVMKRELDRIDNMSDEELEKHMEEGGGPVDLSEVIAPGK